MQHPVVGEVIVSVILIAEVVVGVVEGLVVLSVVRQAV